MSSVPEILTGTLPLPSTLAVVLALAPFAWLCLVSLRDGVEALRVVARAWSAGRRVAEDGEHLVTGIASAPGAEPIALVAIVERGEDAPVPDAPDRHAWRERKRVRVARTFTLRTADRTIAVDHRGPELRAPLELRSRTGATRVRVARVRSGERVFVWGTLVPAHGEMPYRGRAWRFDPSRPLVLSTTSPLHDALHAAGLHGAWSLAALTFGSAILMTWRVGAAPRADEGWLVGALVWGVIAAFALAVHQLHRAQSLPWYAHASLEEHCSGPIEPAGSRSSSEV